MFSLKTLAILNSAIVISLAVSNVAASNDENPKPVLVTNFPAAQDVTGTVSVDNLPATQTVDGTVSVSNFPATQSVEVNNTPSVEVVNDVTNPVAVTMTQSIPEPFQLSDNSTNGETEFFFDDLGKILKIEYLSVTVLTNPGEQPSCLFTFFDGSVVGHQVSLVLSQQPSGGSRDRYVASTPLLLFVKAPSVNSVSCFTPEGDDDIFLFTFLSGHLHDSL